MNRTEQILRKAINELLHIIRMNDLMKKAQGELNALLEGSTYAIDMLEHTTGSEKYAEAKEFFEELLEKVKSSYGTTAISNAYNCFKTALDDDEFRENIGAGGELSLQEKSNIFRKAFDKLLMKAESWDYEQDFYSFFIETVKEIFMPTNDLDTNPEEICPYCDGIPQKIAKAEFFGPHSASGDGFIWGCACGAYAEMDDTGRVIGKLADTILHQKRSLVKSAICELCVMAGLSCFESYRWFSLVTGIRIESIADVEYLDTETCNVALRIFIYKKKQFKDTSFSYPKDRSELFMFFVDGGRLSVCNAYGFQYGKLLIPSEIGPDGIRIFGKDGAQSICLTDSLRYEFKNDQLFILHPSGRKEKFRMFPAEVRKQLFEIKEEEIPAIKAG